MTTTTLNLNREELEVILYNLAAATSSLTNMALPQDTQQVQLELMIDAVLDTHIVEPKPEPTTPTTPEFGRVIGYVAKNTDTGNVFDLGGKLFWSQNEVFDHIRDQSCQPVKYTPAAVYLRDNK